MTGRPAAIEDARRGAPVFTGRPAGLFRPFQAELSGAEVVFPGPPIAINFRSCVGRRRILQNGKQDV